MSIEKYNNNLQINLDNVDIWLHTADLDLKLAELIYSSEKASIKVN